MAVNTELAPHEALELRELLSTKVVSAKKLQASMDMVNDDELKTFMQKSLDNKMNGIQAIQNFISTQ